jgi:hypothetical protein
MDGGIAHSGPRIVQMYGHGSGECGKNRWVQRFF